MSDAIVTALIALAGVMLTALASILTQVVLAKKSQNTMMENIRHQSEMDDQRLDARLAQHQAVTDMRLEELTREVRKHNGFVHHAQRFRHRHGHDPDHHRPSRHPLCVRRVYHAGHHTPGEWHRGCGV